MFKEVVASCPMPLFEIVPGIIKEMWSLERELQYCAVELAVLYKNQWQEDFINTIEACIISKSWWDTVDHIASEWAGTYFKLFPGKIKNVTGKWNQSGNIWLQRTSIIFQKKYREKTDTGLLSKYIMNCAASNEFFIQKAIGWALREYARTDAGWVKQFVDATPLKPLSRREALKHI